jgi:hypothetical protein
MHCYKCKYCEKCSISGNWTKFSCKKIILPTLTFNMAGREPLKK